MPLAPPAAPSRRWPAWCRRSSTACCRRATARRPGRQSLAELLDAERLRPRAARADPGRPAQRAHRPGAESAARAQPDRGCCSRAMWWTSRRLSRAERERLTAAGHAGAGGRGGGRGVAGRRRRQPLDAGRRRGQGAQSLCRLGGKHRTFVEVHLAKSRRIGRLAGTPLPHIITTSYLTHAPIASLAGSERATTAIPGRCCCRRAATSACA